ncbi:MAG: sulfur oxidation c-type cytochrome SoxA [Chromatiales bacterium]|nr:sulfur oxidation c-type cytochrome SoxA [Chromatiales bacterium]
MKKLTLSKTLIGTALATALGLTTLAFAEPKSGYEFMKAETREMQDDEFLNPGMAAVEKGAEMFNTAGANGKTCGGCHGEEGEELDAKHLATYPAFDAKLGKPLTLQQRILKCWTDNLGNKPMKYDSAEALDLEVFVRNRAHGEAVNVQTDGPMKPFWEKGKEIYHTRAGQLDMSCNLCHDFYSGLNLRAQTLSQGQTNGFPTYRLKNGRINGAQSRFSGCYSQFRADGLTKGGDDYTALETYVNSRGNGLKIETPSVRF